MNIYPVFLEIPHQHFPAAARRMLFEGYKRAWPNECLGEDRAGRLWFAFRNKEVGQRFQLAALHELEHKLGLLPEKTDVPLSVFRYKMQGGRVRLL